MATSPSHHLTLDAARELQSLLSYQVTPGLSEQELDRAEQRYGFRFAADHRTFLRAGLPLGGRFPDWRDGEPEVLRDMLGWPVEGVLFDVEHNTFWYPQWGERPEAVPDALAAARAHLALVPQLVPVYGHRYLPGIPGQSGHPVLSVYQTDIISYGADLTDYIHHEFTGRQGDLNPTHSTVAFWSDLVE
ncbi:hypothetical protein GCM10009665_75300 [Kitasatospora nipponensis]|uniref:SMI1/KNR4 family protein n=1 Tax=Kitasatospora nipponensis TaxID=258049 RepID=A0ABN1T7Y1_9ACTN